MGPLHSRRKHVGPRVRGTSPSAEARPTARAPLHPLQIRPPPLPHDATPQAPSRRRRTPTPQPGITRPANNHAADRGVEMPPTRSSGQPPQLALVKHVGAVCTCLLPRTTLLTPQLGRPESELKSPISPAFRTIAVLGWFEEQLKRFRWGHLGTISGAKGIAA
ncbi:uncharacterized protein LOC105915033 [Setaria italica]|uniref:uncharacterized protein LOC105915033 n=1 Tax=Setaria italica TaxID=4555 RepID=UPI000BE6106E|nr:uncharacterized protein LOC105915033 [Setaria italica]